MKRIATWKDPVCHIAFTVEDMETKLLHLHAFHFMLHLNSHTQHHTPHTTYCVFQILALWLKDHTIYAN